MTYLWHLIMFYKDYLKFSLWMKFSYYRYIGLWLKSQKSKLFTFHGVLFWNSKLETNRLSSILVDLAFWNFYNVAVNIAFKTSLVIFLTSLPILLVIVLSAITFPIIEDNFKFFTILINITNIENWIGVPVFILAVLSALSSIFTFIAKTLN